jgi:hypothetical protein
LARPLLLLLLLVGGAPALPQVGMLLARLLPL